MFLTEKDENRTFAPEFTTVSSQDYVLLFVFP